MTGDGLEFVELGEATVAPDTAVTLRRLNATEIDAFQLYRLTQSEPARYHKSNGLPVQEMCIDIESTLALLGDRRTHSFLGRVANRPFGLFNVDADSADPTDEPPSVSYWVNGLSRRQGLAARGLKLLTVHGLRDLEHPLLQATISASNLASIKTAEAAGYKDATLDPIDSTREYVKRHPVISRVLEQDDADQTTSLTMLGSLNFARRYDHHQVTLEHVEGYVVVCVEGRKVTLEPGQPLTISRAAKFQESGAGVIREIIRPGLADAKPVYI
jgi:hypothetical protein